MDGAAHGELGHFTHPSRQVSNPAAVHPTGRYAFPGPLAQWRERVEGPHLIPKLGSLAVSDKLVERLRCLECNQEQDSLYMNLAADRIEELERALGVLLEHRSHCFIPENANEFPRLHEWTERARALLTPSAAPERQ
jgi:hypothetical protein